MSSGQLMASANLCRVAVVLIVIIIYTGGHNCVRFIISLIGVPFVENVCG